MSGGNYMGNNNSLGMKNVMGQPYGNEEESKQGSNSKNRAVKVYEPAKDYDRFYKTSSGGLGGGGNSRKALGEVNNEND